MLQISVLNIAEKYVSFIFASVADAVLSNSKNEKIMFQSPIILSACALFLRERFSIFKDLPNVFSSHPLNTIARVMCL